MNNTRKVISCLFDSKAQLIKHLKVVVKNNKLNYRTFGTEIEQFVTSELIKLFAEKGVIKSKKDYHLAHNKNEFPELTLKMNPKIAIEIKSGNHFKKTKNKWEKCSNSNNDMGTMNSWPNKLIKFGDNIFFIFIEYGFNNKQQNIIDIKIEKFYKFLAINNGKVLKYREKDGNLRPKNFNSKSSVKTLEHFFELLKKTIKYRSKRVIKKHRQILKYIDLEFERLRSMIFG